MKNVDKLMQQALLENVFPGGVLLVSVRDQILFFKAYGYADIFERRKMTKDTVFDLASLTKPLATTPAVMKLVEEGKLSLNRQLKTIIPECLKTDKKNISIAQLLYHASGLPDYEPFFKQLDEDSFPKQKAALRRLLLTIPLKNSPGKAALYSDLGFMLLDWVVELLSGMPLNQYLAKKIYGPIGLAGNDGLFFIELDEDRPSPEIFATTEFCPWRNRLVSGEVHDENASAAGGVEGHAGLFGSAKAVYRLLSALMSVYLKNDKPDLFSKETIKTFFKRHEKWRRTLGFDMPDPVNSSAGKYFSEETIGHLGFTGTSFWMDLTRHVIVILLTNRIHPKRENDAIRKFRPLVHNAVMAEVI